MVVECSNCHARYNVDEKRVPAAGIKVKCHKCQHIIFIQKEESILQPIEPDRPAPSAPAPPRAARPEASLEGMNEQDRKWHARARRLAKALASDLVLYNQDKVEEGLREGTLAQLLGSEIRRSWEYYCQQIPKHIIAGSDYFKEQLNRIVGKGKEIFK